MIVEDAVQPFAGRGKEKDREAFLALLESLPPTTALVLIIPDSRKYRKGSFEWETLTEKHWLMSWVSEHTEQVMILDCALPTDSEMNQWMRAKAAELGGSLTPCGREHAGGICRQQHPARRPGDHQAPDLRELCPPGR